MARAAEVLAGTTLTVEDDRRDYGESRFITIGFLDCAMVIFGLDASDKGVPGHQYEEGE